MKIVIAPDSFKGSLSAEAAALAMAAGVREVLPEAEIVLKPMADGGEGTVQTLVAALGGELRRTRVHSPLLTMVEAEWGWVRSERLAIIESAAASGLHWVEGLPSNAGAHSSLGTGELIKAALNAGARRIVLGLGGTATTDGGKGLLEALGVGFLDAQGESVRAGGVGLIDLDRIDVDRLDSRVRDVEFFVACDVDNVLCGPAGAAAVFGPQKGATAQEVIMLDHALQRFADRSATVLGVDRRDTPGAGAAGGMGFAIMAYLAGRFQSGAELVGGLISLEHSMADADLVLTGEGRLDRQTLRGKTPVGVASFARKRKVPVFALAGSLGEGYAELYSAGISAAFSIAPGPIPLADAIRNSESLLRRLTIDVIRVWSCGRNR